MVINITFEVLSPWNQKKNNSFFNNMCATKDEKNFLKAFLDKLFGCTCTQPGEAPWPKI